MSETISREQVASVRAFNRFYTDLLGVLNEGILGSSYSLTEARVLYELAHRESVSAAELASDLKVDPAYLSRLLKGFEGQGLVTKRVSERDRRARELMLTDQGRQEYARLDSASTSEISALLAPLPEDKRAALSGAMAAIRRHLGPEDKEAVPFVIRPHRPGDIGWVIHRHAALYTREYGWDGSFEGFVAEIAAEFLKSYDPARTGCWIAERDGAIVGSVFIADGGDGTAKLRMLYVEPEARGLGIGARLVDEAVRFAHGAGYRRVALWTNDILTAARRLYEAAGFTLAGEEAHRSFGKDLIGQNWVLEFPGRE